MVDEVEAGARDGDNARPARIVIAAFDDDVDVDDADVVVVAAVLESCDSFLDGVSLLAVAVVVVVDGEPLDRRPSNDIFRIVVSPDIVVVVVVVDDAAVAAFRCSSDIFRIVALLFVVESAAALDVGGVRCSSDVLRAIVVDVLPVVDEEVTAAVRIGTLALRGGVAGIARPGDNGLIVAATANAAAAAFAASSRLKRLRPRSCGDESLLLLLLLLLARGGDGIFRDGDSVRAAVVDDESMVDVVVVVVEVEVFDEVFRSEIRGNNSPARLGDKVRSCGV